MAGLSKHSRIIMLKPLLLLQMAGLSIWANIVIILLLCSSHYYYEMAGSMKHKIPDARAIIIIITV